MDAKQAVDCLQVEKWQNTPVNMKLGFLKKIQSNIALHMDELVQADNAARGVSPDNPATRHQTGTAATVSPIASNVSACIDIYKLLAKGEMPKPANIKHVADDIYDVQVAPLNSKDKMLAGDSRGYLRIKGKPQQINPLEKEGHIIAVLGAGNYSSSFELIRALFIDNCVVVHKPHQMNANSDKVWAKILNPLVDYQALSYCDPDAGEALVKDERLKNIYFTGGSPTANAIKKSTSVELVSECGGNNPGMIVPGDRPWTEKELHHQALHIATFAKLNGGAACGRVQTLVICKQWPQRREFLDALQSALRDETPAVTSYYPGSDRVFAEFQSHYPEAKLIQPESSALPNSGVLFIEDVEQDSFATQHEAFCQVVDEVVLDTAPTADAFLPKAVEFANNKLHGTLGACILIDEDTKKAHRGLLDQAVTDLKYGGIAINTMPPYVWLNLFLTWGGNEEGSEVVSGQGNFGNLLSFENIEKSIIETGFMSPGHLLMTNKEVFHQLSEQSARYNIKPSWLGIGAMVMTMMKGKLKSKDF